MVDVLACLITRREGGLNCEQVEEDMRFGISIFFVNTPGVKSVVLP